MDLSTLESFISLSETLSFTKTAKALGLTQPSISRQLKQLEEQLGIQLFFRDRHRVELTPEGKEFKGSLTPLLRELRLVFEQSREKMSKPEGLLSFCCYPEIGQYFFMRILLTFQEK